MIEFEHYQVRVVDQISRFRRGCVKSPAGSGKTIMGTASALRWARPRAKMARRRMRVAIVAHTIDQVGQWERAGALFPELAAVADVKICCYASGLSLVGYDLAICDECHHIAAPEYCQMLDGHEGWRWGFSATPDRQDDRALLVFELLGPVICEVTREEVRATGRITAGRVIILQPNEPKEMESAIHRLAMPLFEERARKMKYLGPRFNAAEAKNRCIWQVVQQLAIAENARRNDAGLRTILEHDRAGDSTLVLIGNIEHGRALAARVPGSMVLHSQMRRKDTATPDRPKGWSRAEALAAFASGDVRTAFATSLADEGLDVPRANVLVLMAGGRSERLSEQRTGRVLRAFNEKAHGTIYDFFDCQHFMSLSQSKKRIEVYKRLGYDVSFARVEGELV